VRETIGKGERIMACVSLPVDIDVDEVLDAADIYEVVEYYFMNCLIDELLDEIGTDSIKEYLNANPKLKAELLSE
jgi:hypothetical protein